MGNGYDLACFDCRASLALGKTYFVDGDERLGFSLLTRSCDPWSPELDGIRALQHFLLLHRLHELRVIPEYESNFHGEGFHLHFPKNLGESDWDLDGLLSQDVSGARPETDVRDMDPVLKARLDSL